MQLHCSSCGCAYAADQAGGLCPRCLAAMAVRTTDTPPPETPFEPGETFHGLRVQSLIARGGMGIVYRARQPVSNRDVALKILPRSLAIEEEFRLRFDREARALAGLNHPNIVNLYDYGIDGDLMFLVMEFVDGVSLREELRDRRIPPARALQIALDLCEALQFAHREGVIHRDIKPENVLIDKSGRVKLTDFGLAKRIDTETTQLTQTNFAIGTPHYMAPEQLEQPKLIDHRVDVYSMGVLLYEMLTRELPIGRFPAPSSKQGVDERLDDIVYRCLEKNPDDRYGSVGELKAALESASGKNYESAKVALADDRPAPPPRPKVASNHEVNCPCGWQFYVPAAARGTVHCPSCGDPLRLTVATPARAATPRPVPVEAAGEEPAPVPRLEARIPVPRKLLVAIGALSVLVVAFLFLVLGFSRRDPAPQEIASGPKPRPRPIEPVSTRPGLDPMFNLKEEPKTPANEGSPKDPARPKQTIAQLRAQLESTVSQANMAGIVGTILLNSGRADDHELLQNRLRQFDGDIKELLLRMEEQGFRRDAPERFRSGDRLTAFGNRRLEPARTLAFADSLRGWLRAFQPNIAANVTVTRNRVPTTFEIVFPERSPELVALAHQVGVVLGETPGVLPEANEVKVIPTAPFPVATVAEIKAKLASLPAFYRGAIPYEDRGRADALLLAGQGSREDLFFLTGRYMDLLRRCEAEQKSFTSRLRELEARLAEPTSVTDTVVCKDRKIEGTILEETQEYVKIKARFGGVTIDRSEIVRIEKGKGSAAEFKTAYEAARGQKTELIKLLGTAKERKLPLQTELAAVAILVVDPGDERARIEAGVAKTPFTGAAEPDPALSADRVEFRGKMYTLDQLRTELKSLGYVLVNGLWCEKVPKTFKIDNLYRIDAGTNLGGASIQTQSHTEKDTVYDIRTKAWVPRNKIVQTARYIGSGGCTITIDAPGDLIEARVRARSQVSRSGGYVQVAVLSQTNESPGKILYTLAAPGENDSSYDVSDKIFGLRTFYIRADVKGDGMFLCSDSNDLGVLEVKYTYGKPLERVNALFGRREAGEVPAELRLGNESVEANCRAFAAIASQNNSIADAMTEMRNATEGVAYSRDFMLAPRFADVGAQIKDPLDPQWNAMTRDQALRLGQWWGSLPIEDRREFLSTYGVWCARARYLRAPR